MSETLKDASRGGAWSALASAGSVTVGLLFAAMTIRFLGLEDAGLAQVVTQLFALIAGAGGASLSTAVTGELSRLDSLGDSIGQRRILGMQLAVVVMISLLFVPITWLGADFILAWANYKGDWQGARLFLDLSSIAFSASLINSLSQGVYLAKRRYELNSIVNLLSKAGMGIAAMVVLTFDRNLRAYGWLMVFWNVLLLFTNGWQVSRLLAGAPLLRWDRDDFARLWRFGKWVYASNLLGLATSNLDRVVIVSFFGTATVPIYNMARRSYETIHNVLNSQMYFLFPLLARTAGQKRISEGSESNQNDIATGVESRLYWFVGLLATWAYCLSICWLPTLLRFLVSTSFARKVWVPNIFFAVIGIIHATAIVPYLIRWAQGEARSNFLLNSTAGLLVIPLMWVAGSLFGWTGAVAGQAGIAVATLVYLNCTLSGPFQMFGFFRVFGHFRTPLIFLAAIISIVVAGRMYDVSNWLEPVLGLFVAIGFLPLMLRLENHTSIGRFNVGTLRRAYNNLPALRLINGRLAYLLFGNSHDQPF